MSDTFVISTPDLRQALASVLVHASTDKGHPPTHRVRLTFDREHLTVTATDRITMALAVVSLWHADPVDGLVVELLPDDAKKVLTVFKEGQAGADDDGPEYKLRIVVDSDRLILTDCSGMIDGRSLSLPRLANEDALAAVVSIIAQAHDGQTAALLDLTVSGDSLARFKVAGKTYGSPLSIEPSGKRLLLIRCGESFLGVMSSRDLTEEDHQRHKEFAEGWSARLPEILAASKAGGPDT